MRWLAIISSNKGPLTCVVGYYDSSQYLFGEGVVLTTVVEVRSSKGFGFDPYLLAASQSWMMDELTLEEKNQISRRGQAQRALLERLS